MITEVMVARFEDSTNLVIPDWVIDPFESDISSVPVHLREIFLDLKNDEEMKVTYRKGYGSVWLKTSITPNYACFWEEVKLFLFMAILSFYQVQRGFSVVVVLMPKVRSRLDSEDKAG